MRSARNPLSDVAGLRNDLPMIREWKLLETNLHRIRQRHYEVAVIPTAATEAHNLHLPEGLRDSGEILGQILEQLPI